MNVLDAERVEDLLVAEGHAEGRFLDLDPSIASNRRFELARRVDIVIASER